MIVTHIIGIVVVIIMGISCIDVDVEVVIIVINVVVVVVIINGIIIKAVGAPSRSWMGFGQPSFWTIWRATGVDDRVIFARDGRSRYKTSGFGSSSGSGRCDRGLDVLIGTFAWICNMVVIEDIGETGRYGK